MPLRLIIGATWGIVGVVLFTISTANLAQFASDPEFGWGTDFYAPSWWYLQIAIEAFILACALIGAAILTRRRWSLRALRVFSPIALAYLVAYDIFGGERAWWVSVGALALTVVVAASMYYAYRHGDRLAA
jgi:hypothetical protein